MNIFTASEIVIPLGLKMPASLDAMEAESALVDYVLGAWPMASVQRLSVAIGAGKESAMSAGIESGKAVAKAVMERNA